MITMAIKQSEKKELATSYLKRLRKDLRQMHAGVTEEQTLPDPIEVRNAMTQMEELLEILEPKSSKRSKK